MRFKSILIYILIIYISFHIANTELITVSLIGIGSAIMAGSFYKWGNVIKDHTICNYKECCNDYYVPYDIDKLRQLLTLKMIGQPLVFELVNILAAHKDAVNLKTIGNRKPLVISLHGWSGVGKNYAATMVAEALYKNGMHSNFVKIFMGKKDFDCTDIEKRKQQLIEKINETVRKCPTSLIIFDEIHDMCPSILDTMKPLLDYHHAVDDIDYRDSVFIFISNIEGETISNQLLQLYKQDVKRNNVAFSDFEPDIRKNAYRTGGFEKSSIIAQHLIDHYIPFLPMEQPHVEMCALAEFRAHGVVTPTEEMMADALSVITYGPTEDEAIFANNGCKRFTRQIPYVIKKHTSKKEL